MVRRSLVKLLRLIVALVVGIGAGMCLELLGFIRAPIYSLRRLNDHSGDLGTSQIDSQRPPRSKPYRKELGLLELWPGQDPVVDIVAIHGLNGHREETWTAENGIMWLKDLLPFDLPNARILTYGYDAHVYGDESVSTQTIFRHAETFAGRLSQQRKEHPERPIIFISHSLGGIILKKTLSICHSHQFDSDHKFRDIAISTRAVLFFGTPHSGANGVLLAEWMRRVLSVYMPTTNEILKHLDRDSPVLEEIGAQYRLASERIDNVFFYEEYPTPIARGMKTLIVPRPLATIEGDHKAKVVLLHEDHRQMVKFMGKDDESYCTVIGYLRDIVADASLKVQEKWVQEYGHRNLAKGKLPATQHVVLPKPLLSVSRNYIQRPHTENQLTEKLLSVTPTRNQPRCVLHGLAGGGKTQIALSWIETHKQSFSRIVVIDASSQQQIEADLETAIRSIGPQYSRATWKDAIAYFSGQEGWLFFLDNADSPDLRLDNYFPTSIHGAILMTTRNYECINYAPDCHIAVGKMRENEAIHLLHAVANVTPSSNDSSLAIVKELGMWALAITQAGAYISKTGRLDTYLPTFRKHRDKLMREASLKGRNYQGSTYTAFDLSFSLLTTRAQNLMKICAFLHYSSIPLSLFERSTIAGFRTHIVDETFPPPSSDEATISNLKGILGAEWDDYSFQEMIDSISCGSLLDTSMDGDGQFFYNVHPLVQAYVRDLLSPPDQELYAHTASQLLLGAIQPLPEGDSNAWYRQLSAHIDSLPMDIKTTHVSHALSFLIVYKSVGNWNASAALEEYTCSQFRLQFGPKHPFTLTAMREMATTLRNGGQLDTAEKLQRQVLAMRTETVGPRHLDTIIEMDRLALTLQHRSQLPEAERIQRKVLALRMEILGSHRPDTIMAMSHLATTLRDSGQLEEAEKMEREALRLRTESEGSRHPDSLIAMGRVAITLRHRGQFEAAAEMEKDVLRLRKEVLGPQHHDTIMAMANLATTLRDSGRLEEAEEMEREALRLRTESYGPRHPDTLIVMGRLALTLQRRGRLQEAEGIQREVLELRVEVLGPEHPDTITAMGHLALTYYYQGRLEEAEKVQQRVLTLRMKVLGTEHPQTIQARKNLDSTIAKLTM